MCFGSRGISPDKPRNKNIYYLKKTSSCSVTMHSFLKGRVYFLSCCSTSCPPPPNGSSHVSPSPACHLFIFFFSFDTALSHLSTSTHPHPPIPAAWYSGAGTHAPSQIHQLRSECRTTTRVNRGMRGAGREEGGVEEDEGRSAACRHPSGGPKP